MSHHHWHGGHRAVADSLEEAGERLFTFTRLPPSQWRSLRTTNAIERLHEEFKRRIKTQTVLPSADPHATCVNRFQQMAQGIWDRLLEAVSMAYDGDIQMIGSSSLLSNSGSNR